MEFHGWLALAVEVWRGQMCMHRVCVAHRLIDIYTSPTSASTLLRLHRSAPRIFGLITRSGARLQRLLQPIVIEHASTPLSFGLPLRRPLGPQCHRPWSTSTCCWNAERRPPQHGLPTGGVLAAASTSSCTCVAPMGHDVAPRRLHRRSRFDTLVIRTGHRQPLRVFFVYFEHRRRISKLPPSPL
uniref:Uncharacterized protein n=1 Tax=Oryza barthii TaxID=65489 RepID=A0A0D3EYI9_9ORYZ